MIDAVVEEAAMTGEDATVDEGEDDADDASDASDAGDTSDANGLEV